MNEMATTGGGEIAGRASAVLDKIGGNFVAMSQRATTFNVTLNNIGGTFTRSAQNAAAAAVAMKGIEFNLSHFAGSLQKVGNRLDSINTKANAFLAGFLGMLSFRAVQGLAGAASPNGMGSVDKATDILSGTIGSLLLPGFVAVGAASLMAADRIRSWIDKNLEDIVDGWTTAIELATAAAEAFAEAAGGAEFGRKAGGMAGKVTGNMMADQLGIPGAAGVFGFINNLIGQGVGAGIGGAHGLVKAGPLFADRADKALNKGPADPGGNKFLQEFAGNMDKIIKDMEMDMGPPSRISDPAGRWREIALEVNKSDLEMRKMEMHRQALDLVKQIADSLKQRAAGGAGANAGPGPVINFRIRGR